jgi:hypothetical protein
MGKHKNGVYVLSTKDIIQGWISKKKRFKNKEELFNNAPVPPPINSNIISLAIVLDGKVQEIMRAESGFASLLVSQPTFHEFSEEDPDRPFIGYNFVQGKFMIPDVFKRAHDQQEELPSADAYPRSEQPILISEEVLDEQ